MAPFPDAAARAASSIARRLGPGPEKLVRYIHLSGAELDVSVVWDEAHVSMEPTTGAVQLSQEPVAGVSLADLVEAPQRGDRLQLSDGREFVVHRIEPDGVAAADLFLHRLP